MSAIKEKLKELRDAFEINIIKKHGEKTLTISGIGWQAIALHNYSTTNDCHVFEVFSGPEGGVVPPHEHTESRELIFVVKGELTINDNKYFAGDYAFFEPRRMHEITLSKDSACIVIQQPIEEAWKDESE